MMDERGWGWSTSEIRQAQLVEWIAQQPADQPDQHVSVEAFYEALPDQAMNAWGVADGDLKLLEERSLIRISARVGGALQVHHTHGARDLAEQMRLRRADIRLRKAACRDAMVDWLYSLDATSPLDMPARDAMLDDPQRGIWLAEPFSARDLDVAAAWLSRHGLVKGIEIDESEGPVRLYLTDEGVRCAEAFDSYADHYVEAQERAPALGPTVHIGTNSGSFQVAGDNAHQVQNIGASTDELRKQITSIAELVRVLVPDASDVREAEQGALAAATAGAVDRSMLQRFADWALSTVRAGATAAVLPAVTSATTAMMLEAGRVTGLL